METREIKFRSKADAQRLADAIEEYRKAYKAMVAAENRHRKQADKAGKIQRVGFMSINNAEPTDALVRARKRHREAEQTLCRAWPTCDPSRSVKLVRHQGQLLSLTPSQFIPRLVAVKVEVLALDS